MIRAELAFLIAPSNLTTPVSFLVIQLNWNESSIIFQGSNSSPYLHCDFYDDSTQLETWLDSKYGIYYENLNKVYLRDSVVVITVKGDTLKSPDLWWDQGTKMFYTDKYATYHGVGKNIYGGKGMEATQDLKRIMFKETTGNLKVSENGFPQ